MTHPCFNDEELLDLKIVQHGHFILTSGRHSDLYVEKFRILEKPSLVERACKHLLAQIPNQIEFDIVAGPATGGIIVAYEIGRQSEKDTVYVESKYGIKLLRRGTTIPENSRVLVVDDVLTTGLSIKEVMALVSEQKSTVVGACVIVDRSDGINLGVPCFSAIKIEAQSYAEDQIPEWLKAVPVSKPGTRK